MVFKHRLRFFPTFLLGLATICLLNACVLHTIDVQQGTMLDDKLVNQLKTGMSEQEVVLLIGNPLIRDPFLPHRWDYIYTFKPGSESKPSKRKRLIVFFDDKGNVNKLSHEPAK